MGTPEDPPGEGVWVEWKGRPMQIPSRDIARDNERLLMEHVLYHVAMVYGSIGLLFFDGRAEDREFDWGSMPWVRANAVIEGFLAHVRVLDEFLYKDQLANPQRNVPDALHITRDDAMAMDFVVDARAWLAKRPKRPPALDNTYRRFNKTVAHLSRRSVRQSMRAIGHDPDVKVQDWSYIEIADALREPLNIFLAHVRPEFSDLAERARAAAARIGPTDQDMTELGRGA